MENTTYLLGAEQFNKFEILENKIKDYRTQATKSLSDALILARRLRYFYETIAVLLEDKYEDKTITKAIIKVIKKELPQYENVSIDLRKVSILEFHLTVSADWKFIINLNNQQKFSIKRFLSDNDWAGARNIAKIHRYVDILDVLELPISTDETDTVYTFLSHWQLHLLPMFEIFLELYDKMEGVQFIIPEEVKKPVDELIKIRHKIFPNNI